MNLKKDGKVYKDKLWCWLDKGDW